MYVLASFEHSIRLEMALTGLEKLGIVKENILAVPLDKRAEENKLFDTIHQSDGISLFDTAAVLATAFMVLGVIYGFEAYWGPIIWGLIGMGIGGAIGFMIKYLIHHFKRNAKKQNIAKGGKLLTEVIVMIRCQADQKEMVKKYLWEHGVHGVAELDQEKKEGTP